MMYLLNWLDDDGLGLDGQSKERILTLLDGAFGSFPGTARDAMRDAISDLDAHAKMEYCSACDGCGWYEGGPTLRTECEKCKGTGLLDMNA